MSKEQLPLALNPPRRPRFDNFVAGPNDSVLGTLRDGLEPGGWYFLAGAAGTGRSHLASAVFADRCRRGEQAVFLALSDRQQWALLEHSAGDWVVIDDVDAVAGDEQGERALFNALNRWRAGRVGVVMSGAGRGDFVLPDLRSRLGQATRLALKPLDESELADLVRRMAAEYEVVLGRGVVDYLLTRVRRNAAGIGRLVESCASRALVERRTLSIPLVREELGGATRSD